MSATSQPVDPKLPPAVAERLAAAPPLTTEILPSEDWSKGLKLIADSVAQQRQIAAQSLIFSAPFWAIWTVAAGLVTHFLFKTWADIGTAASTTAGITMAMLLVCRMLASEYLVEAEKMTFAWLRHPDGGDPDLVIGTRFGNEIIGSLVLRLEGAGAGGSSKRKSKGKGGKALIRGWAVRLRFRHKGIGTGLLEEAVRVARERLGRDVEIGFAADHANSKMVLPAMFNGGFLRRQRQAVTMLEEVQAGKSKR